MSISHADLSTSDIIDRDRALALADRRAREAGDRLREARLRGQWLFGFAFPLAVTVVGALLGVLVGEDLADTAVGRSVLGAVQPAIDVLMAASTVEYLVGCAFLVMAGLVWIVRS